jgi:hypothetical protein
LKKTGIQIVETGTPQTLQEYAAAGKRARQSLVGKLYDQAFLDRIEKTLADYRASQPPAR